MTKAHFILSIPFIAALAACAPQDRTTTPDDPMRAEFMESCSARPEYGRKRRDGTIDRYCGCFFDSVMKGLPEEQRILAGFYLYGEQSESFKTRYTLDPDYLKHISVVSKAMDRAGKVCR